MPISALQAYERQLPKRIAEFKLNLAEIVSLTNMRKSDRQSTLRRWQRDCGQEETAIKAPLGMLAKLGIGVRHGNK
jgi:hypothetical protein